MNLLLWCMPRAGPHVLPTSHFNSASLRTPIVEGNEANMLLKYLGLAEHQRD